MKISVLIRNLNEAESLKATLLSLQKQKTAFDYEIIVVDNESEDDSVDVAKSFGCRVYSLPRKAFSFGKALNYGIAQCGGEIILNLSAHIILLNEYFLENIPAYFDNEQVAGLRFVLGTNPQQVQQSILSGPQQLVFEADENFTSGNWNNFIVNHCSAIRKKSMGKFTF